jgi:ATP-dependent DNA helicase RecG
LDHESALTAISRGARAADLESSTLEFKQDGRSVADALENVADAAICLANTAGGTIVIGVSDRHGGQDAFVGTRIDAEAVKRRVYQLSTPPLLVNVSETTRFGARLLLVFVPQGMDIHADTQGRALRRVGTDCLPMTPNEQLRLREDRQGFDWSARPSERSTAALSKEALVAARSLLSTTVDERRKLSRSNDLDLLRALGVVDDRGNLNRAGEILFCAPAGDQAKPAIAYQYRSTPGGEARAVERLAPPLVLAFRRVLEAFRARNNVTPLTLATGQQIQIEDYPTLAAREAFANAIVHRDYHQNVPVSIEHSPDLLVVTSPGPLVAGITPENILTHPPKPRNPALANVARILGFAEELGRGVDRMYREMIRSGRDIPSIDSAFDHVRVVLPGGAPKTQIARYVAELPEMERDDTDTMLVLFKLCSARTITAQDASVLLQKRIEETGSVLRRLATDQVAILEPTRQTANRAWPHYRLRGDALKALGSAVSYQRRTVDEIDRKVIAHVREYGKVTNRTVQNLLDVNIQRAKGILMDLVKRRILVKTSPHERGPGVEYGPGTKFPPNGKRRLVT